MKTIDLMQVLLKSLPGRVLDVECDVCHEQVGKHHAPRCPNRDGGTR